MLRSSWEVPVFSLKLINYCMPKDGPVQCS